MHERGQFETKLPDVSAAELLRRCGENWHDQAAWEEFSRRYTKRILLYLLRAARISTHSYATVQDHLHDLAQEVYVRLLHDDARILRTFRGASARTEESEFMVRALLARIATSVVQDFLRRRRSERRKAEVIPIDDIRSQKGRLGAGAGASDDTVLAMIDLDRTLDGTSEQEVRDLLIFKLHFVHGFTASEVAAFPGFGLTQRGIEAALHRMRTKLRGQGRRPSGSSREYEGERRQDHEEGGA